MTQPGYTHIEIPNSSLALFNQIKAEEAGRRGIGRMKSEDFFLFMCYLYMQVRNDDIVMFKAKENAEKQRIKL